MACYVTGIVATSDVSELEKVIGDVPNIDHSKLSVITREVPTDEHETSFLNFIHLAEPGEGDNLGSLLRNDTAIMTSGGGTGVPGIERSGSGLDFLNSEYVEAEIGIIPIPEDERANYNDALAEGRTVITYECSDADANTIETALHQAGVRNVKTFRN